MPYKVQPEDAGDCALPRALVVATKDGERDPAASHRYSGPNENSWNEDLHLYLSVFSAPFQQARVFPGVSRAWDLRVQNSKRQPELERQQLIVPYSSAREAESTLHALAYTFISFILHLASRGPGWKTAGYP